MKRLEVKEDTRSRSRSRSRSPRLVKVEDMDFDGLNILMWDEYYATLEGLKNHSILYRKCLEEGRWQYTLMDDNGCSCTAVLETGSHSRDDPLKGQHNVHMKVVGRGEDKVVTGIKINDKTLVKRV